MSKIPISKTIPRIDEVNDLDHEMTVEKWQKIAEDLWQLLDDVDTASDMFKPKATRYNKYINDRIKGRFKYLIPTCSFL